MNTKKVCSIVVTDYGIDWEMEKGLAFFRNAVHYIRKGLF